MRLVLCVLLSLLALSHATPPSPPSDVPSPPAAPEATAEDAAAEELAEAELDELPEPEEAAAAEAAEPPASPPAEEEAEVQFMVTQKMKAELAALGYDDDEIAALEPERAAAIIARGIARPPKGVPTGWNKRAAPLGKIRLGLSKLTSSKIVSPAVGGTLGGLLLLVGGLMMKPKPSAPKFVEDILPAAEEPEFVSTSTYWIDRQLDKLEFWLKKKLGKR